MLEVQRAGFWTGSSRFVATASAFSDAQRTAVQRLEVIQAKPGGGCLDDAAYATIKVTDSDGDTVEYLAHEQDSRCESEQRPFVSFASYKALSDVLPACLSASDTRANHNTQTDALSVGVDNGCYDGFFGSSEGNTIWTKLNVQKASATHVIRVESNHMQVVATAFAENGTDILATSQPSSVANETARLEMTFARTGTYFLKLEKTKSGGAGDFHVNVSTLVPPAP